MDTPQVKSEKTDMFEKFRAQFNSKIAELNEKKDCSSSHLPWEKYRSIVNRLNELKASPSMKKVARDYRLLKQYEVVKTIGDDQKVVEKLQKPGTSLMYVSHHNLFDVISQIHVTSGHGARDVMHGRARKKYVNVTKEALQLYTDLCHECQLKRSGVRRVSVDKPALSNVVRRRCRVDVIDMRAQADRDNKFVMTYQDHRTKYICLKAMKSGEAAEVANNLVDVFCSIGSPPILQSNNGREFACNIITEVKKIWPQCILVHGTSPSDGQGAYDRLKADVLFHINNWVKDNRSPKWADGLRFVQWQMNNRKGGANRKSPYAAMFYEDARLGVEHANLPNDVIVHLRTEDDLTDALSRLSQTAEVKNEEAAEEHDENDASSGEKTSDSSYGLSTRGSVSDYGSYYNPSVSSSVTEASPHCTDVFCGDDHQTDSCGYDSSSAPGVSMHCDTICPCPEFAAACKCLECCPCNNRHRLKRPARCLLCGSKIGACDHTRNEDDSPSPSKRIRTSAPEDEDIFPIDLDFDKDDLCGIQENIKRILATELDACQTIKEGSEHFYLSDIDLCKESSDQLSPSCSTDVVKKEQEEESCGFHTDHMYSSDKSFL